MHGPIQIGIGGVKKNGLFWPQYESGTSPDSSTEYITLSKKIFPSNFMEMFLERKEIITA